jgi:phosphoglycolate phosphatase-like HAD superfamily hydrolase
MPMVTFCLVLTDLDGVIVDSADSLADLDYSKAYPYTYWEVCARYEEAPNAGGPIHCIARVNLAGSKDFDKDFEWAITQVRTELVLRDSCGDFDNPELLSDGPVIDIGYESEGDNDGSP